MLAMVIRNFLLLIITIGFLPAKSNSQNLKGSEFHGKYLYTHSFDKKIKEYNDVISKCFKLSSGAIRVLQSYDSCIKGPIEGIAEAIGECSRKDRSHAYFFDTKNACDGAREDADAGASS